MNNERNYKTSFSGSDSNSQNPEEESNAPDLLLSKKSSAQLGEFGGYNGHHENNGNNGSNIPYNQNFNNQNYQVYNEYQSYEENPLRIIRNELSMDDDRVKYKIWKKPYLNDNSDDEKEYENIVQLSNIADFIKVHNMDINIMPDKSEMQASNILNNNPGNQNVNNLHDLENKFEHVNSISWSLPKIQKNDHASNLAQDNQAALANQNQISDLNSKKTKEIFKTVTCYNPKEKSKLISKISTYITKGVTGCLNDKLKNFILKLKLNCKTGDELLKLLNEISEIKNKKFYRIFILKKNKSKFNLKDYKTVGDFINRTNTTQNDLKGDENKKLYNKIISNETLKEFKETVLDIDFTTFIKMNIESILKNINKDFKNEILTLIEEMLLDSHQKFKK